MFALHGYTVLLLLAIAQRYLIQLPAGWWGRVTELKLSEAALDNLIGWILLSAMGTYFTFALHRAYDDRPIVSAVKATVLAIALLFILALYRALLFFTTYWAT